MKQGGLVCMCLILVSMCFVPVLAQPSTNSVETIVVDDFDTPDEMTWTWNVTASRFAAEGFPKTGYFDAIPNSLRPIRKGGTEGAKVFGVHTSFNRKGDNWIEIVPVTENENGEKKNHEIDLIGNVKQIDFWVWGANYLYNLDVLIRDAEGRVNVLSAGKMNFNGWKNMIIQIPSHIRQKARMRSGPKNITFVGFRIRTDPGEYVDDFMIYFDQVKYTTYILSNIYDGFDLRALNFEQAGNKDAEPNAQ